MSKVVDSFLAQVDAMMPPEVVEGVVEEEIAAGGDDADAAAGSGGSRSAAAAAAETANYDKELRKMIAALEMSFNSGIANVKKVLDETKDAPHLLPGRTAGLTSSLSTMDLKVKKGIMDLKRKLMDIGKKKDEL